ncbi:MAG: protein-disulfide reductase DsbD family protein [Cyclobacteriaceae bacterium]
MRKGFLLLAMMVMSVVSFAQPGGDWTEKISWSFKVEKIDESHAYVVGTAKLAEHWHVFSVDHDMAKADFTGMPTSFAFTENANYKLIGKLKDGKKPITHEDVLGTSLFFEGTGVFKQKIEVLTDKSFDIDFEYEFQICDEMGCLFPPAQEAKVKVSGFKPGGDDEWELETDPEEIAEVIDTTSTNTVEDTTAVVAETEGAGDPEKGSEKKEEKESTGLWGIFFLSFAGGFVALLTPCVFPMIPMTVTFFTKQSKSRAKGITNALIYGASIIIIYVILGLLVTAIMGPTGLNELSTNVYMNIFFFLIFMVFAVSFLGAFEIRMPSSWVNKADSKADKGGLVGIFFMAFVLGLVSFSCTGPIIGTLLVEASNSGSILGPAIGMVGFSTALAIPFTLFAIFPGWLNSLPQSGGWLNSVKVVLGLLEIALALKFLSMVDLAYHWDFLTREIFVALWVVIFLTMGIYLLGLIKFSHDSPVQYLSVTRYFFAMFALSFAIYLLPGMWGAPLSMIDGVAPPRTHSEDNFKFVRGNGGGAVTVQDPLFQEYRAEMHEVGDGSILVFHDMDKAKEYATKVNKPLMLDFTGHACANCRKTESTVWTNDAIRPILQEQLVIVSLYCDDREKLPESEWYYSEDIKGKVKTVGNKWSDYQVKRYGKNAQPLYVIQDLEGNDLTDAIGYTPDIEEYKNFLLNGIEKFKSK